MVYSLTFGGFVCIFMRESRLRVHGIVMWLHSNSTYHQSWLSLENLEKNGYKYFFINPYPTKMWTIWLISVKYEFIYIHISVTKSKKNLDFFSIENTLILIKDSSGQQYIELTKKFQTPYFCGITHYSDSMSCIALRFDFWNTLL